MCRRLKTLRDGKGYNQQYVARWLSISQAAYSRLESGEVELTLSKLILLGELYHLDLTVLIQGI